MLYRFELNQVKKSTGVPGKVKLNIYQLALAKLAQREKHQTVTQEVPSFILTGGDDFLLIFCYPLCKPTNANIINFVNFEKKPVNFLRNSCLRRNPWVKLVRCILTIFKLWIPLKEHLSQLHTCCCIYSLRSNILHL